MSKLKMFAQHYFKKYRGTTGFVIFLLVTSYAYWPIEPIMPTSFELYEVVGMPKYINTTSTTNSGEAFKVNDMLLNCDLGSLSGTGGCEFFRGAVDLNKSARATYFWMPTRLWYHYKVLYSLEQDGKMILSPEQSHAWFMRGYRGELETYHEILWIGLFPVCIFWLLETFGGKPTRSIMED